MSENTAHLPVLGAVLAKSQMSAEFEQYKYLMARLT